MTNWLQDLAFGFRLAFTGHRPWGRLVVTAVGIGLGVAVLLGAATVPNVHAARIERENLRNPVAAADSPGAGVLVANSDVLQFGDSSVRGLQLRNMRGDAPVAPGLTRNPEPGEMVVSPKLQELLQSPVGELLRPRLPGEVVGVIGQDGLTGPGELFFYVGSDSLSPLSDQVNAVFHHFGETGQVDAQLDTNSQLILLLSMAALLVPIVVYVAATARLAEAARQRRLAAMRLVGATGRQVRRMAVGEALAGAVLGVALGWVLFALVKPVVEHVGTADLTIFSSDVRPVWSLALLITLGIPALAALVTTASLRRSIVQPLQVARRTSARPRKLAWRLVPVVAGLLGLVVIGLEGVGGTSALRVFLVSVVLVLAGVPLLLPWCVERIAGRLGGGSTAWQLAVRRLQMTSGTAARSVSAIAVVVTGVIALQTLVASVGASAGERVLGRDFATGSVLVDAGLPEDPAAVQQSVRELQALPGVDVRSAELLSYGNSDPDSYWTVHIADCAQIAALAVVTDCADGDVFATTPQPGGEHVAGATLQLLDSYYGATDRPTTGQPVSWTVPGAVRPANPVARDGEVELYVTPAAATGIPDSTRRVRIQLQLDPAAPPEVVEHVRNVAAAHLVEPMTSGDHGTVRTRPDQERDAVLAATRLALLAGALVVFALIGCSLFVSAAEQIQERRRPLAVLGAVGVPRRTMAWSLLLQNAVPMLVATALAAVTGLLMGVLVVVISQEDEIAFDVPGMLGLLAFAAIAVVVVTALSLPAARRATRPEGLRTE
ncbi:FtsX-like permease family protein [Saccharopolyspora hirsuta]|uniref:FtsX-like permease family protein n=1 Tax=Saccharopolyspora hirsuta TaxID=1837 RepID=A0A5M7C492_SACHI|nr:FtsX-like permease family protein [Saccharopolyspora hirsuta]KAA5834364.1 FtsX-like permease family protein [Saccharopolyspora hirsuta]